MPAGTRIQGGLTGVTIDTPEPPEPVEPPREAPGDGMVIDGYLYLPSGSTVAVGSPGALNDRIGPTTSTLNVGTPGEAQTPPETPSSSGASPRQADGWEPSETLLAALKAAEGPPNYQVKNGHACYGHDVSENDDEDRFTGKTLTEAECHALLIEDAYKARHRALEAIQCPTDNCVQLCFWLGCNHWGSRYGTETRGQALIDAAIALGKERGDEERARRLTAGLSPQ